MQSNEKRVDKLDEYQTRAMSTRLDSCDNITYMAFGLVAEVGELADKIAKWKRKKEAYVTDDHLVFNTWQTDEVDEKHVALMKELGDVLWFVAGIADHFDYPLSEVAEMNLEKLAERKTQGTIVTHEGH